MRNFNEEQRKFIVRIFAIQSSATQIRREFLHHYGIKGGRKRSQFTAKDFESVNHHFDITGSVHETLPPPQKKRLRTKRTRENAEKLKVMLNDKQQFSVRTIAPQLTLSHTTVRRILRYDTKTKFYRPSTVQPLTEDHKEQRRIFCNWLLPLIP